LLKLTRQTLDENGFNKVVVVAGTGAQSTRETIQLCEEAKEAGAAFALVLTPSTFASSMTKDNILRFHRAVRIHHTDFPLIQSHIPASQVADKSPIPTMVYNYSVVTAGIDLNSDIIAALATHPNIVGTKLSCGNIGKLHRLASVFPASEFAVFPGISAVFAPGLLAGGAGVIGALVNLVPKVHTRMYALWEEGRVAEAMRLQAMMAHGDWAVGNMGGIGALKGLVVKHFGYGTGRVRGPLPPAKAEVLDSLKGTMLQELIDLEKSL